MADALEIISTSTLIDTGKGWLAGVVISCNSTSPAQVIFYDNTVEPEVEPNAKVLSVYVSSPNPVIIFFQDRFAPRYNVGLFVSITNSSQEAATVATIWTHEI